MVAAEFVVISRSNSYTVLPCGPCAIIWTVDSPVSLSVLVGVYFMHGRVVTPGPKWVRVSPHLEGGWGAVQRPDGVIHVLRLSWALTKQERIVDRQAVWARTRGLGSRQGSLLLTLLLGQRWGRQMHGTKRHRRPRGDGRHICGSSPPAAGATRTVLAARSATVSPCLALAAPRLAFWPIDPSFILSVGLGSFVSEQIGVHVRTTVHAAWRQA